MTKQKDVMTAAAAKEMRALLMCSGVQVQAQVFSDEWYPADVTWSGTKISVPASVVAVWPEPREDERGAYIQLMALCVD